MTASLGGFNRSMQHTKNFVCLATNTARRAWGIGSGRFVRIWQYEAGANASSPATTKPVKDVLDIKNHVLSLAKPSDGMTCYAATSTYST
jgi:hypothetical protein